MIMCFRSPFSIYKCGHCPECLQDSRRDWSIRLQVHAYYSNTRPYIAHLTYDNGHIPINDNGVFTLRYKDVQDFLKRLRYYLNLYYESENNKKEFKYFIAGEYGPNGTHRPHYHCILFGLPEKFSQDEANLLLQKAWQNGFVRKRSQWVQSYAQLHYCTKYLINYFDEDFSKKVAPFKKCSNGFGQPFVEWAKRTNFYNKLNIQDKFHCITSKKFVRNSRCADGGYYVEVPKVWLNEIPAHYECSTDYIWLNPLLVNFPDYIEFVQTVNGVDKLYRFPLPRYFAEQLYTKEFRLALATFKDFRSRRNLVNYQNSYFDYDMVNEDPMWLQLKRYNWERKKKNKKDKNLRIDSINILND